MISNQHQIEEMAAKLREVESLKELKSSLNKSIKSLRIEEALIRQTVKEMHSWESGNASNAFKEDIQDFFESFSKKIDKLEAAKNEVAEAISTINMQIEIVTLDKFSPKF